jgi:hypothetical protein
MTLRDFRRDINNNLKKNLQNISAVAEKIATDLTLQLEEGKVKSFLNSALDLMRPHFISLGGRVSILAPDRVEVLLPLKARNLDEFGLVLPSVQIGIAIEAFKLLWSRSSPTGEFQITVREVKTQFFRPAKSDLIIKAEVSDVAREVRWAELKTQKKCETQTTLKVIDRSEQLIAEVEVRADFFIKDLLEWK